MSATLLDGLRVQRRVVWALMLRETKTLFGKHKLGYLWAVINAAFQVGVFWAIREVAGFNPPHGMSTPVFLLAGFIPFYIFSNSTISGMNAISGNRALLVYPQVYPLDIIVARSCLQSAVYSVVYVLLLGFAGIIGQKVDVVSLGPILLAMVSSYFFGLSAGILCSALNLLQPTTSQIVPMIVRVMFFSSGMFYSIIDLPTAAKNILYFNPFCHIVVFARSGFVVGYGCRFLKEVVLL